MTDEIDLDELDTGSADDEPDANRGDWFWRGEGDPDDEPDDRWSVGGTTEAEAEGDDVRDGDDDEAAGDREGTEADESDGHGGRAPAPHVPRSDADGPVGIPVERGGAGAGTAGDRDAAGGEPTDETAGGTGPADATSTEDGPNARPRGGGPHGGGVDDMTMALTYDAVKRLADPQSVTRAAEAWADWIGIVGDVPAHVINKLQREEGIDADFFSGAGQGPIERLRDVDENSMFYAERLVVVGEDGDEELAAAADWEFVHVETAAEKAGWELTDPS